LFLSKRYIRRSYKILGPLTTADWLKAIKNSSMSWTEFFEIADKKATPIRKNGLKIYEFKDGSVLSIDTKYFNKMETTMTTKFKPGDVVYLREELDEFIIGQRLIVISDGYASGEKFVPAAFLLENYWDGSRFIVGAEDMSKFRLVPRVSHKENWKDV
jgi:hypothetical protein